MELGSQKRLKTQLLKLIKESNQGNNLSNQIVSNLSPDMLMRLGLEEDDVAEVMEEQDSRKPSGMWRRREEC